MKSERHQICFDIDPKIKQQVKLLAIKRNISMNMWIMRAIVARIQKENNDQLEE